MKRILQAMDGVATKPVVGASDMARFLRVVKEADLNQMPDPRQDTQADGTPTYTADELADIQHPNAAEWVAVRNQIQDAKAKGIDPAEIAKLQAHYDQLAGGNAERWEQTYAKNQAVKAADQAAGYNNNVQYVNPTNETMDKFLSIVKKNDVSILNEGSPHKVSLPVQMAMQHYQQPKEKPQSTHKPVGRETTIGKYFHKVEDELAEQNAHKRQLINQYASTIAERVIMREGKDPKLEKIAKRKALQAIDSTLYKNYAENMSDHSMGFKPGGGGDVGIMPNEGMSAQVKLSRAWDREKAKSTASIERAKKAKADFEKEWKEKQEKKSQESNPIKEANAKKRTLKNSNPCWKGYHPVGTKKKGKRTVPNCVPKE